MMDFKHLPPHLRKLFETELKDLFNQKKSLKPFSSDAIHEMLDKAQAAIELDRKDIEQKIQEGTIYKEIDVKCQPNLKHNNGSWEWFTQLRRGKNLLQEQLPKRLNR